MRHVPLVENLFASNLFKTLFSHFAKLCKFPQTVAAKVDESDQQFGKYFQVELFVC